MPIKISHVQKCVFMNVFWNSENYSSMFYLVTLTLSWRRPLSYRNQFIDLRSKSMDLFLYDNGLRHERVKVKVCKWNLCNSTDPSQMKMSFHFFPKSVVLRKTSLNMCVLKYKIKNPRILRVCDITKKYLIFQIVQKFG